LRFYERLSAEIDAWLNRFGLAVTTDRRPCDTAYNGENNSGEMISNAPADKQKLSSPWPEN
jgi:beta-lactamase class A